MASDLKSRPVTPRIIIHGGAGNITRENLPPESEKAYRDALLEILHDAHQMLQRPSATAVDVATHAVARLEDNPLFNAGRGAVFTRAGTNELEASVMVSRGSRKRGVGLMRLTRVRNPVLLAREMLLKGEADDGGGAQQHCQLSGEVAERLAGEWGLELVKPSYFWTRKRWEEHRKGLGKSFDSEAFAEALKRANEERGTVAASAAEYDADDAGHEAHMCVDEISWNGRDYLPQGTVGSVVMDSTGTICAATSTGGLTNKLESRIGDTPTLGAGFWAEQWASPASPTMVQESQPLLSSPLSAIFSTCFRSIMGYSSLNRPDDREDDNEKSRGPAVRAVGMSGTGNGDSFLRVNAVRTAAAIARFSSMPWKGMSLEAAVTAVAGSNGMLQQSAGEHWRKTGEGEGGIIGIEFDGASGRGHIVADFNCGGMFRAWIDDDGEARMSVFR